MNIIKLPPLKCQRCNSTSVTLFGKKILCFGCHTITDNTKKGKGKVSQLEPDWWKYKEPEGCILTMSKKEKEAYEAEEDLKEFKELIQSQEEDSLTPEYFDYFNRRSA